MPLSRSDVKLLPLAEARKQAKERGLKVCRDAEDMRQAFLAAQVGGGRQPIPVYEPGAPLEYIYHFKDE